MEKFTKGPWVISADKIGVRDTSNTQSYGMIQEVCWIEEIFYSSEESKANAYLITAAPEMYEMLKYLSELNGYEIAGFMENSSDVIDLLAKARGES